MNNLILTFLLLSLSAISIAQDCPSGQNFDSSLNRCVLTTSTVDTKTEANNCGGLTGEAQQNCYKQVVDTEVQNLENEGKVEEETKSKGKYILPAIMTIGSSYFLFSQRKSLAKCAKISLGLMAGAGLTTLLGEIITQKSYKSKLKKVSERYNESISNTSTDTNDDLARINANQTNAFKFQIDQEKARESAHKSRRNVYNIAAALYGGAAIAALWEIIFDNSPCSTAPDQEVKSPDEVIEGAADDVSEAASDSVKSVADQAIENNIDTVTQETVNNVSESAAENLIKESTFSELTGHAKEQALTKAKSAAKNAAVKASQDALNNGATRELINSAAKNAAEKAAKESLNKSLKDAIIQGATGAYFTPIKSSGHDNIDILKLVGIKYFQEYSYINDLSNTEVLEILTRKVINTIIPSAHASEPVDEIVVTAPQDKSNSTILEANLGSTTKVAFNNIKKVASAVNDKVTNVVKSPVFRAAFAGVLAGYSKIVADKASKHAKEAKERVKAITEIRDGFLANGGAGLTNCTTVDRSLPSKPTCYCYESDGSRRDDRSNSPTCQAVFGAAASDLPGATDFNSTATNTGSFSAQGCLTNTGGLDEQCQCQRTNTCSTISGNLNLGNLGKISGLTQAVSDASNFTNGTLAAGDINAARLEQGIANISAQKEKFENNPKIANAAKKVNDIEAKLQRSFGNSVRNAFNNPKTAGDLASLLSGSIGGEDSTKDLVAKKKPTKFKAGQKVEAKASAPALRNGSKAGVSLDDFDFSTKNKGGIKVEDGAKDLAEGKFKIDDINDKTEANIFSIISNRYQTTGLKTLFGDDKKQ